MIQKYRIINSGGFLNKFVSPNQKYGTHKFGNATGSSEKYGNKIISIPTTRGKGLGKCKYRCSVLIQILNIVIIFTYFLPLNLYSGRVENIKSKTEKAKGG